jgi:polyadenylate-binding protein
MSSSIGQDKYILFISELPENTKQSELENFFADYKSDIHMMQIDSNQKIYDYFNSRKPKATIIFKSHEKAAEARDKLNMKKLKGKALNIMWHERDNSIRYNNKANLFVKGISPDAQPRQIYELFAKYGEIISCKICENEDGDLLGYGYINYYDLNSAQNAIENLNKTKFLDSELEIEHFQRKNERLQAPQENCTLYIKNIPEKYTNLEELKKLFSKYGKITFSKINKDNDRYFAIIMYSEAKSANKAKEELNDKKLDEKDELPLYVDSLQKKSERKRMLTTKIMENNNKLNQENKNCNLYIKNLPRELTEEKLKEIFSKIGEVKSVKIDKYILQTKVNGENVDIVDTRGFGYVCYKNEEDAKKAIEEFNEKKLPGFESSHLPVLVSKFMPKNERKQYLNKLQEQQNNYSQNMPQPPYPMIYSLPPRPMPNRFYKNNNYNYRRPQYPPHQQQQMVNQAALNQQMNNLNLNNNNSSSVTDEPDYEKLKSFKTEDEQKDYLGEFLFKKIEQHPIAQSKNLDVEAISKITGMILGIGNINEIFDITTNPEHISSRIKEALELLEKSNQ